MPLLPSPTQFPPLGSPHTLHRAVDTRCSRVVPSPWSSWAFRLQPLGGSPRTTSNSVVVHSSFASRWGSSARPQGSSAQPRGEGEGREGRRQPITPCVWGDPPNSEKQAQARCSVSRSVRAGTPPPGRRLWGPCAHQRTPYKRKKTAQFRLAHSRGP
jgi:hypothetical protein